MKVLLFVQAGNARPKCASRETPCRVNGEWWYSRRASEAKAAADRWWLVECANAEDGRAVIAAMVEYGGGVGEGGLGRILASGGRHA